MITKEMFTKLNVAGVLLLGRNHMHVSHSEFFFVHCKKNIREFINLNKPKTNTFI